MPFLTCPMTLPLGVARAFSGVPVGLVTLQVWANAVVGMASAILSPMAVRVEASKGLIFITMLKKITTLKKTFINLVNV